jgi:hypothetical protein
MSLGGPTMSNLLWVVLLAAALVALACLSGGESGPCCSRHAKLNPSVFEAVYCSNSG